MGVGVVRWVSTKLALLHKGDEHRVNLKIASLNHGLAMDEIMTDACGIA